MEGLFMRFLAALGGPEILMQSWGVDAVDHSDCNADLHPTPDGFDLGSTLRSAVPMRVASRRAGVTGEDQAARHCQIFHGCTVEDSPASSPSQIARQGKRLVGFWKEKNREMGAGRKSQRRRSAELSQMTCRGLVPASQKAGQYVLHVYATKTDHSTYILEYTHTEKRPNYVQTQSNPGLVDLGAGLSSWNSWMAFTRTRVHNASRHRNRWPDGSLGHEAVAQRDKEGGSKQMDVVEIHVRGPPPGREGGGH